MSSVVTGWTDTHCHIHDDKMTTSSSESLQRARDAGVSRFVVIGTDAETSAAATSIAAEHDDVWATVGLHPHDATNGVASILPFISLPKVIAIGECGLDYYYEHSPRDVQLPVFAEQIALAKEHNLTLVIHTRDAWKDTFDVLDAEGMPDNTIIHCFSGGPDEARQCLDRGAYLSFSGIVTFPSATELHAAARLCPVERRLIETDSPYLAPIPHRGRTNRPQYVTCVAERIAQLCDTPLEEVARASVSATRAAFPALAHHR